MSVAVIGIVWPIKMSSSRKIVLLKLADSGNDDGSQVFPSIKRIADECGLSERTVQYLMRGFEEEGIVILEGNEKGGRNLTRIYRLNLDLLRTMAERSKNEASERVQPVHRNVRKGATDNKKGATDDTKGCKAFAPDPSLPVLDPSLNTSRARAEPKRGRSKPGTPSKPPDFEAFWARYPIKRQRLDALDAWKSVRKVAPAADLMAALEGYLRYCDENKSWYSPKYPATWLRKERWRDFLGTDPPPQPVDEAKILELRRQYGLEAA